jgi:hypothetical protein
VRNGPVDGVKSACARVLMRRKAAFRPAVAANVVVSASVSASVFGGAKPKERKKERKKEAVV